MAQLRLKSYIVWALALFDSFDSIFVNIDQFESFDFLFYYRPSFTKEFMQIFDFQITHLYMNYFWRWNFNDNFV